jgi:hypothetical protein
MYHVCCHAHSYFSKWHFCQVKVNLMGQLNFTEVSNSSAGVAVFNKTHCIHYFALYLGESYSET